MQKTEKQILGHFINSSSKRNLQDELASVSPVRALMGLSLVPEISITYFNWNYSVEQLL